MANVHLPHIDDNNTLRVTRSAPSEHQYVIILGKSHGRMRFSYAMIDPESKTIIPKLNTIVWARLVDTVDFATCVFKNCLYVLGGIEKSTGRLCREVHKYDPYVGRWKQCADMCKPRARHAAAAVYGKLFVFGGMTSPTAISDTCESYEPLIDEWTEEETKLPEARKDHSCVVRENNVYIIGGTSPTQVANDNVWVLCRLFPDPRLPDRCVYEWSRLQDPVQRTMGYKLSRHSTAICNDRLYVFGGVVHGRTSDGVTVVRQTSQPDVRQVHEINGIAETPENIQNIHNSPTTPISHDSEDKEKKMLIATSSVVEAYKFRAPIPDFGIDADVEEAGIRLREEEEKQRQKESRRKQRNKKRRGKKDQEMGLAMQEAEDERKRRDEEQEQARLNEAKLERLRNRTSWKSSLSGMPHPRCSAGTVVVGNKIYMIGGHRVEDDSGAHVNNIEYYHTKQDAWYDSFELGDEGDFTHVDCCILTIPKHNKDFKPMTYTGCKWAMW